MDVLVLGGTGVVGRPLLTLLTGSGHRVRAAVRTPAGAPALTAAGVEPVHLPVQDLDALTAAMTGCEAVVDLRTSVPPLLRAAPRRAWREHDRLRDEGTATAVAAAERAGVRRLVRDSVAFLHADGGERVLDEDAPLDPGEHLASSLAGERHATAFTGEAVVLRLALLYGPASSHTRTAVRLARTLGVTPVLGPAQAWTPSLHHDDAASAVAAALTAPPGTYLVADDAPLRRQELVGAQREGLRLRRLRAVPSWAARGETARAQLRSHRLSAARFRDATGWRPAFPSAREGWAAVGRVLSPPPDARRPGAPVQGASGPSARG